MVKLFLELLNDKDELTKAMELGRPMDQVLPMRLHLRARDV
jgi:hypothetical protein